MQQRRPFEIASVLGIEAELNGDKIGEQRHPLAVTMCERALGIDDLGECLGDAVEEILIDEFRVVPGGQGDHRRVQPGRS